MAKRIWVCGLAALLSAGCRSPWQREDPFRGRTADVQQQQPQADQGVVRSSYEETSDVGASIMELEGEPAGSAWQSTVEMLKPKNVAAGVKKAVGLGPDEAYAHQVYEEGQTLFRQSKYDEAARRFKKAAARWPDSLLEEDALFMLGECYFFSDRYPKASDAYGNLLKKYENSRHLDKAVSRQFAIGRYWDELAQSKSALVPNFTDKTRPHFDARGNAAAVYKSITLNDPTGPLADDATMAVANSYFARGRWEDAGYHYDLLRKNYPQSEHQPEAHVLCIRSKLRSYQGTEYDGKPIQEAEQLIEQALAQFPTELVGERERLLEARRAVRFEKAQRDWQLAEYYHKGKYHRAARFYYAAVIKDYPDTPFAEIAQQRMQETEHLPPEPPNHFRWLANLFPESRKL
ncbi:MAG: outer membrane protein assembly factor BamD [Pirellulales bacterium]